ncbi:M48 family metalloprotease [Halostella sp. JP-L12]|uniref:M48 family metallopeptidase n=1 Tax=Halostella TaxID=1843185 RepID=UPI0013CE61CE|nr:MULTISPECIES: M48 family metalloprotease [Halostella]NHN48179.1 M48 family metalloprotease [Halostella sp. JP-L12]
MRRPFRGTHGLRARTAVAAVLVCVANLAFVMLALELVAFFLEMVVVELLVVPDWTSVGNDVIGFAAFLRETAFWRSPAVVPLTAAFMLAQYEYVSRRPLGTPAATRAAADDRDSQTRLTRLVKQVGTPAPEVLVADKPRPNSYAVGRKGNATVVVTRPLLDALDDDELDAVLAHELAHVTNRDATVMTMAVAPVRLARAAGTSLDRTVYWTGATCYAVGMFGTVLVTIGTLGLLIYRAATTVYDAVVGVLPVVGPGPVLPAAVADPVVAGARTVAATTFDGIVNVGAVLLLFAVFAVPPLAAVAVYYVALGPVPRLLARYREFAADRAAARITGDPAALASALATLSPDDRPDEDYRRAGAVGELCLLPGGIGDEAEVGPIRAYVAEELPRLERLLRAIPVGAVAHPETDERVERLRALAREQAA